MQISCPTCEKQLRVPDTAAGKKVKCPGCGNMFVVSPPQEQIQAPPPRVPKAPPPPLREEVEEDDTPRNPRRSRRDDDEQDEDRPRRARRRDEEEEEDDDRPARSRSRRDYDDEDDDDDYKSDRKEARRRAGSTAIWFLVAGIVSLLIVAFSVISALVMNVNAGMGNPAFQTGRIAGVIGCGMVGAIGGVSHILASRSLRAFQGKGQVITAIVFGFIFGLLFGGVAILGVVTLATVSRLLSGGMMALIIAEMLLRSVGAFVNLFAAIKGITTLNNRAVSRMFRGRRD